MGVEEYLVKPFMPQELLEILHNVLQERVDILSTEEVSH